jgi:purine-binding chemotaxis protein CheW
MAWRRSAARPAMRAAQTRSSMQDRAVKLLQGSTVNAQMQEISTARDTVGLPLAGKYLTFRLENEEYGIQIHKVNEIIGLLPINKLPMLPAHVGGLVNLRNRVIPTIDLRAKFGLDRVPDTSKTCIVVVEVGPQDRKISLGVIVDEVAEVLSIGPDQVDSAPEFGPTIHMQFVRGIGLVDGRVKILLDIDHVLTDEELGAIRAQNSGSGAN